MSVTTTAPRTQVRWPGRRATDARIAVTIEEPATPFPITIYFIRVHDDEITDAVAVINVGFEVGTRFDKDPYDEVIPLGERLPRPLDGRAVEAVVQNFRAYVEHARHAIEFRWSGQTPGSKPRNRRRRELTDDFLSTIAEQYEAWSAGTGHAVTEISKAHGVNRSTASRWVDAARERDLIPKKGVSQ
jgi:hypothetical protein